MRHVPMKQIMVLLLLCGLLAGCGETAPAGDTTETTTAEETAEPRDGIPEGLDLGGQTVNITIGDYSDAWWIDMYADEQTGNRLNDVIYDTIVNVESRLNVELEYYRESFAWATMSKYETKITSQILAGDPGFDILFSGSTNFSALLTDGHYFGNLAELKYVDLERPWYNQHSLECIPDDYVDFVLGEFAIGNVDNTYCFYFNQTLLNSMGIKENIYAIVDEGKWTLDKLSTLIKGGWADLNGNTEQDAEDRWGLTFGDQNKYCGFLKSCGMDMYRLTDEGFVFEYDNERAVNTLAKLRSIIFDSGEARYADVNTGDQAWQYATGGSNYASKPFVNGNVMFTASLVADAQVLVPELSFEWGILPYPKYDETMDKYQSVLQRYIYAMIPSTLTDTDAAGAVLEALSSETYYSVIPEYVEVSLKVRYSPDEDAARMFDLIRNNIVNDPGEIYSNLLGYPSAHIKTGLAPTCGEWASFIAGHKESMNAKMETIRPVVNE